MKPPRFGYLEPATLSEALVALEELHEDCKVLAGGQSLVPLMNMRLAAPSWLIDISRVEELRAWAEDDAYLRVGAGVTQAEIEDGMDSRLPLLRSALQHIGHRTIRNRGTVCGSLAHADPSAELPAVAVALGAVLRLAGARRVRDVSAAEFFTGPLTTVLEPNELLTEVFFPVWPNATGSVAEVARRHGDFALAGAAAALGWQDGRIVRAGVALFGVAPVPLALREAEERLVGSGGEQEAIVEVAALAAAAVRPTGDYHASREYRRAMAGEMTRKALEQAVASRPPAELTS